MPIQFSIIDHNVGYAVEGKSAGKRTHFNTFHPEIGRPGDVMDYATAQATKEYLEAAYAESAES